MKLSETTTPLAPHLLDLLDALKTQEVVLTLIGGFGLILRQEYLKETGQQTLLERIPVARATEDFDVLLHLELMADLEKIRLLQNTLHALGYEVISGREYLQFRKSLGDTRTVKIDLLTQQPEFKDPRFTFDERRVRPKVPNKQSKGSLPMVKPKLHAHPTPEAFAFNDNPLQLMIEGNDSGGQPAQGTVHIPHPYAYLMLKLFAFRDWETRKEGENKLLNARKHARDVYTIIASLTVNEYDAMPEFTQRHGKHAISVEASSIVQTLFSDSSLIGVLRVQEGWEQLTPDEIEAFLETLQRAFPKP
jgi:hypothetical protein